MHINSISAYIRISFTPRSCTVLRLGVLLVLLVAWASWFWLSQPQASWPVAYAYPMRLSPNGQLIALPSRAQSAVPDAPADTIELRSWATATTVRTFATPNVLNIAWSANGQLLAATSSTAQLWLWDIDDTVPKVVTEGGNWLSFSPDQQLLAIGRDQGVIQVRSAHDGKLLRTFQEARTVRSLAFSPNGTILVSDGSDVIFWRVRDGGIIRRLGEINPTALAFSPDGVWLAVGIYAANGGEVHLWRVDSTAAQPEQIYTSRDTISALAFSHDGQLLAAAGGTPGSGSFLKLFPDWPRHNPITIWRVRDGARVQTLAGHLHGTSPLQFTPDDRQLVSGGGDHTIRVWRVLPIDPLLVWGWRLALALALGLLAWRWLRNYWRRHRAPAV